MSASTPRARLSPTAATVLMLGLGTAALVGLPGIGPDEPPAGVLSGTVSGPDGAPVAGAPVALFEAGTGRLLEITHTDRGGRYGFQQDPGAHHLHVGAPLDSTLAGVWSTDRESGRRRADVRLERAHAVALSVVDASGSRLAGAEVRVYAPELEDAEALGVVATARTDAAGNVTLSVPPGALVGAFTLDGRLGPGWLEAPAAGAHTLTLLGGGRLVGTVVDATGRPLEGALVSTWATVGTSEHWRGYRTTDAHGRFGFDAVPRGATVRALDREGLRLPVERTVDAGRDLVLTLQDGTARTLTARDRGDAPRPATVWAWSPTAEAWSYGLATDAAGARTLALEPGHALFVEPRPRALAPPVAAYGRAAGSAPLEVRFATGMGTAVAE